MRTKKVLLIAAGLFICLTGWSILAWLLANNLIVEKPLAKADAIWVLGGAAAYVERTHEAAEIYQAGIAPKIFLANDGLQGGWNQTEQRNPYFSERARWELIKQGVPEEAIEILPTVVNGTNDEANLFAAVSKEKNLKSLFLVTSAYHSRRALWTFERVLSKNEMEINIGIKSPPIEPQTPSPFNWWLSGQGWQMIGEEYEKLAYYWLFY